MSKHTPGPWMTHKDSDGFGVYIVNDDGTCGPQVANVLWENLESEDGTCDQARGDAKLIAAAPDLLAACQWAASALNAARFDTAAYDPHVTALIRAIDKATK
jgi:hypothetical protein